MISAKSSKKAQPTILETLEQRQMFAVTPLVNFPNFSSLTGLTANGYGSDAETSANNLVLTTSSIIHSQARSIWNSATLPMQNFTTQFTYETSSLVDSDGFTFTLQHDSASAIGDTSDGLGYEGIAHSVAIAFHMGDGNSDAPEYAVATDGAQPTDFSRLGNLDIAINDPIDVTITYNGTDLKITMADEQNPSESSTTSIPVNITSDIGSNRAYVGFTAGSGISLSNQMLENWTYSGFNAPTFADSPSVSGLVGTVQSKSADLSVLGADPDNGEDNLTYDWSVLSKPAGADAPTFSANGTNAAKSAVMRFFKAGAYEVRSTVVNAMGQTAVKDLRIVVSQVATSLDLSPHAMTVKEGAKEKYTCVVLDQFKHAMDVQPKVKFGIIDKGVGEINAISGLFSSQEVGHSDIEATADDLKALVGATVV